MVAWFRKASLMVIAACATLSPIYAAGALSNGYVLCGAYGAYKTVLLDSTASIVKVWDHVSANGYSVYLLENGNLLRTAQVGNDVAVPDGAGPKQGLIEEVDPAGTVVWSYQLADEIYCTHHDMKPLPNGNILAVAFELKTKEEMKQVGVDTALLSTNPFGGGGKILLAEMIFEIKPDKSGAGNDEIVWKWHIWDHIIPQAQAAQHPELFNGSMGSGVLMNQWVHLNGLDYCPRRDLIVFTSRLFCEVFIIDHSTTTAEAKGHAGGKYGKGGDLLYRWGKPSNYLVSLDFDTTISSRTGDTTITKIALPHPNDRVSVLHCCTFIPEGYPGDGHIMFFHNNVTNNSGSANVSQVIELDPPTDAAGNFIGTPGQPFGPVEPTWMYAPADSFHSPYMSSALRMPSGNTLVHEAGPTYGGGGGGFSTKQTNSRLREVTPQGEMIWSAYIDLSGLNDSAATGGAFNPPKIMYYPKEYKGIGNCMSNNVGTLPPAKSITTVARTLPAIVARAGHLVFSNVRGGRVEIFSLEGKRILSRTAAAETLQLQTSMFPAGTYLVTAAAGGRTVSRMVNIIH